jgi:hypothetical protein
MNTKIIFNQIINAVKPQSMLNQINKIRGQTKYSIIFDDIYYLPPLGTLEIWNKNAHNLHQR